jgi:hypothetical protein
MSHAKEVKDRLTTGRASLKSVPLNMISYNLYGDIWGELIPLPSPGPNIAAAVPQINLDYAAALFLKGGYTINAPYGRKKSPLNDAGLLTLEPSRNMSSCCLMS